MNLNRTCPYCQSKIKNDAEVIVCTECKIPHHKECYEFNGGCTTYGCKNNPHTSENVDIGSGDSEINSDELRKPRQGEPVESRNDFIREPVISSPTPQSRTIPCPNCRREIEESSVF